MGMFVRISTQGSVSGNCDKYKFAKTLLKCALKFASVSIGWCVTIKRNVYLLRDAIIDVLDIKNYIKDYKFASIVRIWLYASVPQVHFTKLSQVKVYQHPIKTCIEISTHFNGMSVD